MADRSAFLKTLSGKKTLIFHNYDLLVERQARLLAAAESPGLMASTDVETKRELLLLDDLTILAISARRLAELCGLTSFANNQKVKHVAVENAHKVRFYHKEEAIGFHTLTNQLIHMSEFRFFNSREEFANTLVPNSDDYARVQAVMKARNDPEDRMDGVIFAKSDKEPAFLLFLKDIVEASIEVSEKVSEVCGEAQVFVDYIFRY